MRTHTYIHHNRYRLLPGLVVGGIGQGESLGERRDFISMVREVAGGRVPLIVQGVDTLPEV